MLKIAICDNEALIANQIASAVEKSLPGINLRKDIFSDPDSLLNCPKAYDIALLDIALEKGNGIELAKQLNRLNPACKIIYVTNYLNYATKVYDSEHIYFVLKSDLDQHLPQALQKAISLLEKENSEFIAIEQKGKIITIKQRDILYIERRKRTTYINCQEDIFLTSEPLPSLEAQLLSPPFSRCHNSYLVNFSYVKHLRRTEILLHSKTSLPVSRAYWENIKNSFAKFIGTTL
ncbi:LytTr DNA-binding domain protein [Desulfitobacterium hafniense]|uniref:Stage 0 sporulation protein A homolog n=1 Tax=Desulfitobacterium hafniense TaxID=49338 RepID=A0A098B9D1_DESHA|nr:LytTR family DNA-binding domain-containing protein [Desulfitobacterium hafniense]CDX04972.1 LytTr DNA-binding domain protein [Desulfitobacterium hafniense]